MPRHRQRLRCHPPTTKAVFEAVRAAWACQQGICAERQPSQLWADPLPQTTPDVFQHVLILYLSPDSLHCVVGYRQTPAERSTSGRTAPSTHGLTLYKTHTGQLIRMLWQGSGTWPHLVRWTPCSTQLMVCSEVNQHCILYNIAAGDALVVPWKPAALPHEWQRNVSLDVSPDGKMILAIRPEDGIAGTTLCVDVLRTPDLSLVASFRLVHHGAGDSIHARECRANWLWHPSSSGLIIAECTWKLVSAAPLQAAGIAFGYCPPPAHPTSGSAFSRTGRMLLAEHDMDNRSGYFMQLVILQCTQNKQTYTLDILQAFSSHVEHCPPIALWCPLHCTIESLLIDQGTGLRLVSPYGQTLGSGIPADLVMVGVPSFSPCGTLHSVVSRTAPDAQTILDIQSGRVYQLPSIAHASHQTVRPFWPACGSCIVAQSVGISYCRGLQGGLRPFSLLRY